MNWHYEGGRIYSTNENGELLCEATYSRKENGDFDINHTYVNSALRGQGVASALMKVVADYFRKEGYKTTATCSYANIWLKRHSKEYSDILSEELSNHGAACRIDGKH